MNEIMVKDNVKIENMIFEVRGKQVILEVFLTPSMCAPALWVNAYPPTKGSLSLKERFAASFTSLAV